MPRTVVEKNLSTKEARSKLAVQRKPYWRGLDEGLHLGYRASNGGGAWVLRWYVGNGAYKTANLEGRPDDVLKADGTIVLNWTQAQAAARDFFLRQKRIMEGHDEVPAGPYTVEDALTDYMADYRRRGGKGEKPTQTTIDAHITPTLGSVELTKLTSKKIKEWHDGLAKSAPRLRTKAGKDQKHRKQEEGEEATRRRRSTANRVLTVLKAALNYAYQEKKVSTDDAWRSVKAYREVDAARVRYLNDAEAARLVNSCDAEIRPLVQAAILTGARYGEIGALVASDYNADAGTIHIRKSKSGKARHIHLTEEGTRFFDAVTAGKASDAPIFTHTDGTRWGKSHQFRPFKTAVGKAKVAPLAFHELRHTYASRLVMRGVTLMVVARQLGHSDTRMVEKHYGHMAPNYVADTIRNSGGEIGIVPASTVAKLERKKLA